MLGQKEGECLYLSVSINKDIICLFLIMDLSEPENLRVPYRPDLILINKIDHN